MSNISWPACARALGFLALVALAAVPSFAADPWDAPAFSAEPKALIAAAEKVAAGDDATVMLLDEARFSFEADGRSRTVLRHMYRVVDESAIDDLGTVTMPWAPWYHERPTIAARVVAKDGTVHALDPKAITESPAYDDLEIFSDNRLLRAPLPGVAVGSVIEYTITYDGKNPIAEGGMSEMFLFGSSMPVERSRLVLDGPPSVEPKIINTSKIQPRTEEKDGRRVVVFESARIEGRDDYEGNLPFDVIDWPYVAFSTGAPWQTLARRYEEIVEKQLAGSDLAKFTRDAVGDAKGRDEIVARALAAISRNVRYAGVEVGESSIVPRAPRTVIANKYGDCKDKATLLVAMLRQAGVAAHVALLRSGNDFDVMSDLPGLGRFNHAIVVVDGETPLWVDPTDEFARAGELPSPDQGRMALVASASATGLTRTPETPSSANLYTEIRTFVIPEDGKARLTEVTETSRGSEDAYQRRYYAGSDRTKYREQMESYVKSYYAAKKLEKVEATDPHDLGKPFRVTIEASESGTALAVNGDAAMAFHPRNLIEWIPYALRQSDEERAKDPSSRKRTNDFVFPSAGVHQWTYRVVLPPGFSVRTLPKSETTKLGTATMSREFAAQPDGSVTAVLRFDSGKRRITAAEFEETRVAVSKLLQEDVTNIGFDLTGLLKLSAGDVTGALAEFRKLAEMHPKEAWHHVQIARALLVGGLGDAARAEARRAVALEPKNGRAHLGLAGILEYDLLGRLLRKGFDMQGALAELRLAKQFDPKDREIRSGLAKLLTYGDDGVEFGNGARVEEAVAEYKSAKKELEEKDAKLFDADLMMALAFAGRFGEMKELAKTMDASALRETGRITAVAATDGVEAALKELAAFEPATRRAHAGTVSQNLMRLRLYPQAAEIFNEAIQGAPNASSARGVVEALRKTKRLEEVVVEPGDPRIVARDFMLAIGRGDQATLKRLISYPPTGEDDDWDPVAMIRSMRLQADMPAIVFADLGWAMARVLVDGNDKNGYRLRMRSDAAPTSLALYVMPQPGGRFVIRAASTAPDLIGVTALGFADAGDLESARVWLNWMREDVTAGGGDDPLHGSAFAALWPKDNAAAEAEQIRVAAAALMQRYYGDKALAVLKPAGAKATGDAKKWIDAAILAVASGKREWATVAETGARLFEAYPDSDAALTGYATGLIETGKRAEAESVLKARLEKKPKNLAALRQLAALSARAGDFGAAAKSAERIVDELSPGDGDYNNAAWFELLAGDLEHAVENARRATSDKNTSNASALHTLATVYAETGKNVEARDALLRTLDAAKRDEPASSDWYVIGRMAENYGVGEAARAAYKRVEKKSDDRASVWELAQKRLAAMEKVK